MIVSFGDRATEDLYHNRPTSRARRIPRDVVGSALVKLDMLNAASTVLDLSIFRPATGWKHSRVTWWAFTPSG